MARRHQRRLTASQPSALAQMGVAADVDGARLLSLCLRRDPCAARGGLPRVLWARVGASSTKRPLEPNTASDALLASLAPRSVLLRFPAVMEKYLTLRNDTLLYNEL